MYLFKSQIACSTLISDIFIRKDFRMHIFSLQMKTDFDKQ